MVPMQISRQKENTRNKKTYQVLLKINVQGYKGFKK